MKMMGVLCILFFFLNSICVTAQDECGSTRCDKSSPLIRYPFRLTGVHPERCGNPEFDLSCNPTTNSTEFEFQLPIWDIDKNSILLLSAKAKIQEIDYHNQLIRISVLNGSYLPITTVNMTTSSPFNYQYKVRRDCYSLFNCSGLFSVDNLSKHIPCFKIDGFRVNAYSRLLRTSEISMPNCMKMYNINNVSYLMLTVLSTNEVPDVWLHWPESITPGNEQGAPRYVVISMVVLGSIVLSVLVIAALLRVCNTRRKKRRARQFLEDYKDRRPTRYTYAEIKTITDGFTHKLGQGGFGTVFKGKLSNDTFVAVKVLNTINGYNEDFINEVGTIGKIHHVNVVRLVGYCADGKKQALIDEFLENDSLEKYIASRNHARSLSWEKMHQIAIGIAKGIDYLHQGCNQRILHFDIKPRNILLDNNLNPKVADFGLAKLYPKEKSVFTMTATLRGTIGYIAPEVFSRNFGKVSYKSDIYSFGMLLFDMVDGRKVFDAQAKDDSQIYFPEWMYDQLDKGGDLGAMKIDDGDDIVKRLIIVGLWCIQWYPAGRPSTKVVIQMLEGENLPMMPPNPFAAPDAANTHTTLTKGTTFGSSSASIN